MARTRSTRVITHGVRLLLFLAAGVAAARFFVRILDSRGWSPGAFFGLLLLVGAVALVWRASQDFRKLLRRRRPA